MSRCREFDRSRVRIFVRSWNAGNTLERMAQWIGEHRNIVAAILHEAAREGFAVKNLPDEQSKTKIRIVDGKSQSEEINLDGRNLHYEVAKSACQAHLADLMKFHPPLI